MLKRPRKQQQILADIRTQIEQGLLAAGDQLASVKALCQQYRTGQRTVQAALRELKRLGLISIRRRSGCYVHGSPRPAPTRPASNHILDYLSPRPAGVAPLTLYVSELWEAHVDNWREIIAEFPGGPVDLLSCRHGPLDAVFYGRPLDVIQTTPAMLDRLGADRFVRLETLDVPGPDWAAGLLPSVRERLAGGEPTRGLPFAITGQYLFINLELARAAGLEPLPPADTAGLLAQARAAAPRLQARGAEAMVLPGGHDLLWMIGAVRWEPDCGFVADLARARRLFELIHGSGLPVVSVYDVVPRFESGRLLYAIHCTYQVSEFARNLRFPWQAVPLPTAPGIRHPAYLTVLAVNRESTQPGAALDLVRHLSQPAVHQRQARLHANLPALAAALAQVPLAANDVLSAATVERLAALAELRWPEALRDTFGQHLDMGAELGQLSRGELTPDAAVERFRYYLQVWLPPASRGD